MTPEERERWRRLYTAAVERLVASAEEMVSTLSPDGTREEMLAMMAILLTSAGVAADGDYTLETAQNLHRGQAPPATEEQRQELADILNARRN